MTKATAAQLGSMQGQMEDALAIIKGQVIKCLEIIEVIRVNQDQTDANAKNTEDLLDRVNDNANAALDHVFKQLARYEKALRPMPPVAGAAGGAPRALICKPDLALKPEELTCPQLFLHAGWTRLRHITMPATCK
jgi:hypothetical protein